MAQRFPAALVFLCLLSRASSFKLLEQEVRPAYADDLVHEIETSTEALNSGIGAGISAMNTAVDNLKNGTKAVAHDVSDAFKVAGKKIMEIEKKVQILRDREGNRTRKSHARRSALLLEHAATVVDELDSQEAAERPRRPPDSKSFEANTQAAKAAQLLRAKANVAPAADFASLDSDERTRPAYTDKLVRQVHASSEMIGSNVGAGIRSMSTAFENLKNGTKAAAHDLSDAFQVAGKKIMEIEKKVQTLRELEINRTRKNSAHHGVPSLLERSAAVIGELDSRESAQRPKRRDDTPFFPPSVVETQKRANLDTTPAPRDTLEGRGHPVYASRLIDQVHDSSEAVGSGVGAGISSMNTAFANLKNGTKAMAHDMSDAFKVAGKKIMEIEKKVDILRGREIARAKKNGVFAPRHGDDADDAMEVRLRP